MTRREAKSTARRVAGAWIEADSSSADLPWDGSGILGPQPINELDFMEAEEMIREELRVLGERMRC